MSTIINLGSQVLTFDYLQAGTAESFNKINYRIFERGIYTGGIISKYSASQIEISPMVFYIEDSTTELGVRVETTVPFQSSTTPGDDFQITSTKTYIVARFTWSNTEAWYVKFWALENPGAIESDDIVIGKLIYSGSTLQTTVDYSLRTVPSIVRLQETVTDLRVTLNTVASDSVSISAGVALINGRYVSVSAQNIDVPATVANPQVDIVYIKTDGTPAVQTNNGGTLTVQGLPIARIYRTGTPGVSVNGYHIENLNTVAHKIGTYLDANVGLTANSDEKGVTQKAVKAYIDTNYLNITGDEAQDVEGALTFNDAIVFNTGGTVKFEVMPVLEDSGGTYLQPSGSNNGEIVTYGYYTSNTVKLTGDQVVQGAKTFYTLPLLADIAGDPLSLSGANDAVATTKKYVDDLDNANVKLTGAQSLSDTKEFTSMPKLVTAPGGVTSLSPTQDYHPVPLGYLNTNFFNKATTTETQNVGAITSFAKSVSIAEGLSCGTINTGQGATEVYVMDQAVKTTDSVTFSSVNTGTALKTKIVDIGDWDMSTTPDITVAHGLTASKIRSITGVIRNDDDDWYTPINTDNVLADDGATGSSTSDGIKVRKYDSVNISLRTSTSFESVYYNATSFNRGWLMITYIP